MKTSQKSCTKYLILSGKLFVAAVQVLDSAPTGNPQITRSIVERVIVVQNRYERHNLYLIFC